MILLESDRKQLEEWIGGAGNRVTLAHSVIPMEVYKKLSKGMRVRSYVRLDSSLCSLDAGVAKSGTFELSDMEWLWLSILNAHSGGLVVVHPLAIRGRMTLRHYQILSAYLRSSVVSTKHILRTFEEFEEFVCRASYLLKKRHADTIVHKRKLLSLGIISMTSTYLQCVSGVPYESITLDYRGSGTDWYRNMEWVYMDKSDVDCLHSYEDAVACSLADKIIAIVDHSNEKNYREVLTNMPGYKLTNLYHSVKMFKSYFESLGTPHLNNLVNAAIQLSNTEFLAKVCADIVHTLGEKYVSSCGPIADVWELDAAFQPYVEFLEDSGIYVDELPVKDRFYLLSLIRRGKSLEGFSV